MKILHVVPSMSSAWGGPVVVVKELTEHLVKNNVRTAILTVAGSPGADNVIPEGVAVKTCRGSILAQLWVAHSFEAALILRMLLKDYDLVHIHELWHYLGLKAAQIAFQNNKPYVVTIHGELDPWSYHHKKLKKQIFFNLVQKGVLNQAAAIHCLTNAELAQVRNYGVAAPARVIPNGIAFENGEKYPRQELEKAYPQLKGKQRILFLGRLHQKKGLDILIKAFAIFARKYPDEAQLLIAGPDDGYLETVQKLIKEHHLETDCLLVGMVTGTKKKLLFAGCDVFVLPSYSEGFSVAVLEAMDNGLPVVVSPHCHFHEIEALGAGLVVNPEPLSLEVALEQILLVDELGKAMGREGRKLVREKYSWETITENMLCLYDSLVQTNSGIKNIRRFNEVDREGNKWR